jgi:hypothetical protein
MVVKRRDSNAAVPLHVLMAKKFELQILFEKIAFM